ncbi:MAG: site-2 protease family protein, partial [Planctomycetales bacterium]|nr:site-2 protease family protein [Planctomycetales bacterium]
MDFGLIAPLAIAFSLGFLTAVLKTAFGLGFVIFVHELGHFMVAKMCGVKCEKFYVGFDVPISLGPIHLPRTLFKKQWGETEYGIGIIPLGGYVKMLGQDDNPANAAQEAERIRVAQEVAGDDAPVDAQLDPRSYPAKTVLQRLMIISAGVVMNLIFAVIFATVAYRMGVSYTPTVVGSTSPGLSAWQVGLQPGDRVIQMGRDGQSSEHLRFDKDMMVKVMMVGPDQNLDLLVQRHTEPGATPAPPEWVTTRLSSPQEELRGRPIIGIGPPHTNEIATSEEAQELFKHLPGAVTQPALKSGDKIVAVNETPVADYADLTRELARRVDEPLELTIDRPANAESGQTAESLHVTVPTYPVRELGLQLSIGPIKAIQHDSPAARAGFQVNDHIKLVNGTPVGDPMRLPEVIRDLAGQSVSIVVERDGHGIPIAVVPEQPTMLHPGAGLGQPIAVDELGIAFTIENTVAAVEPDSPAAAAGIVPGDVLETAEFIAKDTADGEQEEQIFGKPEPIELGLQHPSWPRVHERLRLSLPDTKIKLSYKRGDNLLSSTLASINADDWNYEDRGINTQPLQEVHQVETWAAGTQLGFRETWESMRQVYLMLFRLVTGRISPMNLGGPVSIATMAGMEASESTARLLVFLTLLSANLAVVNFLPIPVLDGGHAMFLLYEGIFRRPVNERVA